MAWQGYFEYDGSEFINVTRTEQYAKSAGLHWFRPAFDNDALPYMLGDGLRYTTPFIDDAPWGDPDIPASYDFIGIYPLDVTGIEDSSRSSSAVESLGDGGVPGRIRHGIKTVVFSAVLVSTTEAGAAYGFSWLKRALLGGACGSANGDCGSGTLCYLSSAPDMYLPAELSTQGYETGKGEGEVWVDDPEECLTPYLRSLRKVSFNAGPTITSKRETTDGSAVWYVTFTAQAGSPYELGAEVRVVEGFLDPAVESPWVGGVEPEGAMIDLNGYIADDDECAVPEYQPIYDPLCPAVIPPPTAPSVALGCYVPPKNWRRRQFTIPKQFVPLWGEVTPKVEVHAREADVRNLRLRFYADPFVEGDVADDPCAFCGDLVVSYVPKDHTLVLDGSEQSVYVISPGGGRRRADSLVFKTDGTPFEWPALTCGFGYVVTVDLPQTQVPPVVDLSLFARAV